MISSLGQYITYQSGLRYEMCHKECEMLTTLNEIGPLRVMVTPLVRKV